MGDEYYEQVQIIIESIKRSDYLIVMGDEYYGQLQVTIESIKRSDYLIVMGDFNAILGNEKVSCVTRLELMGPE